MDTRCIEIRKKLKKKLDPQRYEHTLGVTYTCQALAMRYDCDLGKAQLAGLLHDCAKRYSGPEMLAKCVKRGIPVTSSENTDPSLLHAKLGAWMAKEKYSVDDQEILDAIACHTTGRAGMTLLDKILYVADFIEPGRSSAPNLPLMRKLAFLDLDEACLSIMESTLSYLAASNHAVDTQTAVACEDMRRVVEEKKKEDSSVAKARENACEAARSATDKTCGEIRKTAGHADDVRTDAGTYDIGKETEALPTANDAVKEIKEEKIFEAVKRNGKTRGRGPGREKRRGYQNHRR